MSHLLRAQASVISNSYQRTLGLQNTVPLYTLIVGIIQVVMKYCILASFSETDTKLVFLKARLCKVW